MSPESWDGRQLAEAVRTASDLLADHAATLNAQNVFPVPDGDTGSNMLHTMRGALADLREVDSAAAVAAQLEHGALLRGRGNSGIILSQVLRGVRAGLAGRERMDAAALAEALAAASEFAYRSVLAPVEGTMLTVMREASLAARRAAGAGQRLAETLQAAALAAAAAVQQTPHLLQALREAQVVDAGGRGLAIILDGLARYARGEDRPLTGDDRGLLADQRLPTADDQLCAMPADGQRAVSRGQSPAFGGQTYGYCTNLVIQGAALDPDTIRAAFAALGDSVAVVSDTALVRVHLHTVRPGDALNAAQGFGALLSVEISNMDAQAAQAAQHAAIAAPAKIQSPSGPALPLLVLAPTAEFAAIYASLGVAACAPETLAAALAVVDPAALLIAAEPGLTGKLRGAAEPPHRLITLPNAAVTAAALVGVTAAQDVAQIVQHVQHAADQVRSAVLSEAPGAERLLAILDELGLDECELVSVYYNRSIRGATVAQIREQIRARYPTMTCETHAAGAIAAALLITAE